MRVHGPFSAECWRHLDCHYSLPWGRPVHCGVWSSLPWLHPPDARSSTPVLRTRNISRHCPVSPSPDPPPRAPAWWEAPSPHIDRRNLRAGSAMGFAPSTVPISHCPPARC